MGDGPAPSRAGLVALQHERARTRSPPGPPTEIFKAIFEGKFFYILYFQPVGPAEAEFEADPRHFLRTMLYSAGGEGMAERHTALLADCPARARGSSTP